jgi:hypothetical protein
MLLLWCLHQHEDNLGEPVMLNTINNNIHDQERNAVENSNSCNYPILAVHELFKNILI